MKSALKKAWVWIVAIAGVLAGIAAIFFGRRTSELDKEELNAVEKETREEAQATNAKALADKALADAKEVGRARSRVKRLTDEEVDSELSKRGLK